MSYRLLIGKGEQETVLLSKMANRHGLIAGATGTGKTVSLKVMAEQFSNIGVPVFLADVKGDLASLAEAGTMSEKLQERLSSLGISDFPFLGFPIRLWDVFGEQGHPVRVSISEMGALLLARILGLNETQEGILNILFRVADDEGMLLIDLKDLRAMLQYVGENAKELTLSYGNVSKQSIGAIQRALLRLEDQGGDLFFGEPALDIRDLIQLDHTGKGIINILASERLFQSPTLYSTYLLWMLSELFEELPEVGDLDKPRIVFFFDEAHLLFEDAPKILLDKIEQVVRLIRSKGVGVYFVTQNPIDIPDKVLGQLGNRVQHALRAFTPRDEKAVKSASDTFRQNPNFSVRDVITELKTGEALVSFLDEQGSPSVVERAMILPPQSSLGTLDAKRRTEIMAISPMGLKYDTAVDRESAYEILQGRFARIEEEKNAIAQQKQAAIAEKEEAKQRAAEQKEQERLQKEQLRLQKEEERRLAAEQKEREKAWRNNPVNKVGRAAVTSLTGTLGRQIARGILGSIKKGKLF